MTTEELAKLTPKQKRIKIAELCGWKRYTGKQTIAYMWAPGHISNVVPSWARTIGDEVDFRIQLPDYPSDLNDMHEAEKVLNDDQRACYYEWIAGECSWRLLAEKLVHATAAQRADAFLLTLS